jgi:hypothetical protein
MTVSHVKEDLPIEAQLHIDCDKGAIKCAAQAPKLFEYIADKFSWAEQVSTVTSRGLGRTKNSLDRYRSIRTSKWIYEWLNVGSQKIKMGHDGTCPCCGTCITDQLHLFWCEWLRPSTNPSESLN